MPYIPQIDRENLDSEIDALLLSLEINNFNEGELNYVFFRIAKAAYQKEPKYKTINKVRGALQCASDEYYRRIGIPHEEKAIIKNGDIA